MKPHKWQAERKDLVDALKARLRGTKDCFEVIDACDELMRSIWAFTEQLIGNEGTRAVLARSIHLAAKDSSLLQKLQVDPVSIDFGAFREHVAKMGCGQAEVTDALLRLGVIIFQVLSGLVGEAVTDSLLRHLKRRKT